jgi:hypothetical protein
MEKSIVGNNDLEIAMIGLGPMESNGTSPAGGA